MRFEGEIIERYKISKLPEKGKAIRKLLSAMRTEEAKEGWDGPLVAMTWDTDSGMPHFDDSPGYPMLLIDLPASMRKEVPCMAECVAKLDFSDNLGWESDVAVMQLDGGNNTLELVLADVFALLRLSNQGCILVALVCGDDVTITEYLFNRGDFFEVCSHLMCDDFAVERMPYQGDIDWAQRRHFEMGGRHYWQPVVDYIEANEGFYY